MVYPSLHVDNQRVIWWLTSGFEGYCIFRPISTTSLPQLSDQSVRAKRCHWANGRPVPKTTRLATTKHNLWLTATASGSLQLLTHLIPVIPSQCHCCKETWISSDTYTERERETRVIVRKQKQAISKYHISEYIYTYYIFILFIIILCLIMSAYIRNCDMLINRLYIRTHGSGNSGHHRATLNNHWLQLCGL